MKGKIFPLMGCLISITQFPSHPVMLSKTWRFSCTEFEHDWWGILSRYKNINKRQVKRHRSCNYVSFPVTKSNKCIHGDFTIQIDFIGNICRIMLPRTTIWIFGQLRTTNYGEPGTITVASTIIETSSTTFHHQIITISHFVVLSTKTKCSCWRKSGCVEH